MTVDDDNSIYVGGLPYSATEETLRDVFGLYGSIIAVKIINDHGTRGKCFGFVTFRNQRSVAAAIDDMDGKTIDGRVVKVNEATTRGGRSNFGRDRFRRNSDRGVDWGRGRVRDRDYDHGRDRYQEEHRDRSRDRNRSSGPDESGQRGYGRAHDNDRSRDGFSDRDRSRDRERADDKTPRGKHGERNWERDHNVDRHHDREMDGTNGDYKNTIKEIDHEAKKQNGSTNNDWSSREISLGSSEYDDDEIKEQLGRSIQRHEELKEEISQREEILEGKQQLVSDLQKRAKKLEDALINAKRVSSQRKRQFAQLQKCFLQLKEDINRLKSSEQELQVSLYHLDLLHKDATN
ncbi:hypothetical protein Tsubulata_032532 [Turnera subulata]|uniref:RRM domain-containing protein n=1 Tax=Turnera subulata TaxID=218843 RepID=A0A9Q0FK57_9ROSI|nr:hypothetical protein Tsubulata_032532 [Turnera subulata]